RSRRALRPRGRGRDAYALRDRHDRPALSPHPSGAGFTAMRFFESLLYVASIFFVVAYLILIGVLLFHDKGRRTLVLALRSLWLHKMRAMLSVLGIIIGTSAVIALMAFGEGSMQDALEDIKRLGATNIIVRSVKPPDEISTQTRTFVARYGITREDYELFNTIPTVVRMWPVRVIPNPVCHDQYIRDSRSVAATPSNNELTTHQEY